MPYIIDMNINIEGYRLERNEEGAGFSGGYVLQEEFLPEFRRGTGQQLVKDVECRLTIATPSYRLPLRHKHLQNNLKINKLINSNSINKFLNK